MGLSAGATPYFGRRPEKRSPRQPTGLSSAVHCNARLPAETHWLRQMRASVAPDQRLDSEDHEAAEEWRAAFERLDGGTRDACAAKRTAAV